MSKKNRVDQEKILVERMIRMYCRHKEKNIELCEDCKILIDYAHKRLDKCKFGDNKPTCRKCTVHCYNIEMREKIKSVMRFSGPRMLIYSPVDAISHIYRELFKKRYDFLEKHVERK